MISFFLVAQQLYTPLLASLEPGWRAGSPSWTSTSTALKRTISSTKYDAQLLYGPVLVPNWVQFSETIRENFYNFSNLYSQNCKNHKYVWYASTPNYSWLGQTHDSMELFHEFSVHCFLHFSSKLLL